LSELDREVEKIERVCQLENGRVKHPFELVVLALSLLMLPAVLIQDSSLHDPWGEVADGLGAFVWLVFAVEFAFTLHVAKDKRAALRAHWHDALVVLVIFPAWGPLFSVFGPGWLRGWRLARLVAIVARLFRAERLLSRRHNLPYIAALTMVLVVVAGIVVSETDHSRFPNPWRGLWWAIVTVTTVGYGDTFPTSVGGRIAGSVLMVIGIGFLGTATAAIASHFVNTDSTKRHREVKDRQSEILAELKTISERLATLEKKT